MPPSGCAHFRRINFSAAGVLSVAPRRAATTEVTGKRANRHTPFPLTLLLLLSLSLSSSDAFVAVAVNAMQLTKNEKLYNYSSNYLTIPKIKKENCLQFYKQFIQNLKFSFTMRIFGIDV